MLQISFKFDVNLAYGFSINILIEMIFSILNKTD